MTWPIKVLMLVPWAGLTFQLKAGVVDEERIKFDCFGNAEMESCIVRMGIVSKIDLKCHD